MFAPVERQRPRLKHTAEPIIVLGGYGGAGFVRVLQERRLKIRRLDSTSSDPGPEAWFTGHTWIEELGRLDLPTPSRVLRVTFAPRARTEWHSHPHGQVLYILDGVARIGREGEAVVEVRAGDSVEFAAAEMHWHGAGPERLMTFIAVQASDVDGIETTWGRRSPTSTTATSGRRPAAWLD